MENKFLIVLARFDADTQATFYRLDAALGACGQAEDIAPHITLGAYVGVSEDDLVQWTQAFAAARPPLPIYFSHVGLFGSSVCFLAPRVDRPLLDFHAAFHARYDENCGEVGKPFSLHAGVWVPHATLAMAPELPLCDVVPIVTEAFEPFAGYITALDVCESYPMRRLTQIPLQPAQR
ncbi:MAG: 2'-5' RNA ligase family protein [Eubacteriales bacterium]|nr:2'-5' RNA ligase family protein [Eubacteriales bacterium]